MDKDVVSIHNTLVLGDVSKHLVHQSLKRGSGIAETKREDFKWAQAPAGDEGRVWPQERGAPANSCYAGLEWRSRKTMPLFRGPRQCAGVGRAPF